MPLTKFKEYLFNTAEAGKNIDADYLKQTIKFISDLEHGIPYVPPCDRERMSEGVDDGTVPIERPIGEFILNNGAGVMGVNGMYYHYAEVCRLLKMYKE
jgi:hypothetical protein